MTSSWFSAVGSGAPVTFPAVQPGGIRAYLHAIVPSLQSQVQDDALGCFVMARMRSELGEKEEAERLARRSLELNPRKPEVAKFLADMLILQDRMEEAAGFLKAALELNPELPGAWRQLAMAMDRLGDRPAARAAFDRAIAQRPNDALARMLSARLLVEEERWHDAQKELQAACQLDPTLAGAFYQLAQVEEHLGNSAPAQNAAAQFRKLKAQEKAALDAKNISYDDEKFMRVLAARFHSELGNVLLSRDPAAAEAHLRQSLAFSPDEPRPNELLASLLLRSGRLQEAKAVCAKLVTVRPAEASYHANLGTVLLQLKDTPAAMVSLNRALELDPRQPQALHNLARIYLGAGQDLPEALQLARRLVNLQPSGSSYDLLGWALYVNGQTNEARVAAAEAVARDPNNPVYRQRYDKLKQLP